MILSWFAVKISAGKFKTIKSAITAASSFDTSDLPKTTGRNSLSVDFLTAS